MLFLLVVEKCYSLHLPYLIFGLYMFMAVAQWISAKHHVKIVAIVMFTCRWDLVFILLKNQVKKVNQSTCIAPCIVQTTLKRSGIDHTAFNLQRTPCLPLPRKRSPDGASTDYGGEHLIAAHYSFIDPERMKGWVGQWDTDCVICLLLTEQHLH